MISLRLEIQICTYLCDARSQQGRRLCVFAIEISILRKWICKHTGDFPNVSIVAVFQQYAHTHAARIWRNQHGNLMQQQRNREEETSTRHTKRVIDEIEVTDVTCMTSRESATSWQTLQYGVQWLYEKRLAQIWLGSRKSRAQTAGNAAISGFSLNSSLA